MGKSRKSARTRAAERKPRAERGGDASSQPARVLTPNPPRKNLILLVLSGVLLFGFLAYLAVIAWSASMSS
ncbi:MAG: hypothetical protein RIC55_08800 [Pirellulaceae bacterium]